MQSSLLSRCTFLLNNSWNCLSVLLPKMQRAKHHLQHVFKSPICSNWTVLCIKLLPNNRWKILGSLCVASISCPGLQPLEEKYSVGCPEARVLMTTKCPGMLTSFLDILSWTLYSTTIICFPWSASFKVLNFAKASYLVTRHHLGTSVDSIS